MSYGESIWTIKGATLSHKSAQEEFGLTYEEIAQATSSGILRYQIHNTYGSPWLKLVRSEVESFVDEKYGKSYLEKKKIKAELQQVNSALRKLKTQQVALERQKIKLQDSLEEDYT